MKRKQLTFMMTSNSKTLWSPWFIQKNISSLQGLKCGILPSELLSIILVKFSRNERIKAAVNYNTLDFFIWEKQGRNNFWMPNNTTIIIIKTLFTEGTDKNILAYHVYLQIVHKIGIFIYISQTYWAKLICRGTLIYQRSNKVCIAVYNVI